MRKLLYNASKNNFSYLTIYIKMNITPTIINLHPFTIIIKDSLIRKCFTGTKGENFNNQTRASFENKTPCFILQPFKS